MTIWTSMACGPLSRWLPGRTVCCTSASGKTHTILCYAADKMMLICNDFGLTVFGPDQGARSRDNVGYTGRFRHTSTVER